jgi:hypothetical protein
LHNAAKGRTIRLPLRHVRIGQKGLGTKKNSGIHEQIAAEKRQNKKSQIGLELLGKNKFICYNISQLKYCGMKYILIN